MRKIITRHEYPPIPIRSFDWAATFKGDDPDVNYSPMTGWGSTEAQAIADLTQLWEDEHP